MVKCSSSAHLLSVHPPIDFDVCTPSVLQCQCLRQFLCCLHDQVDIEGSLLHHLSVCPFTLCHTLMCNFTQAGNMHSLEHFCKQIVFIEELRDQVLLTFLLAFSLKGVIALVQIYNKHRWLLFFAVCYINTYIELTEAFTLKSVFFTCTPKIDEIFVWLFSGNSRSQ